MSIHQNPTKILRICIHYDYLTEIIINSYLCLSVALAEIVLQYASAMALDDILENPS